MAHLKCLQSCFSLREDSLSLTVWPSKNPIYGCVKILYVVTSIEANKDDGLL
jgi:hypothetical protein